MAKFNWQNGTLVSKAKVEIDGKVYEVEPEQYEGQTPLSAENLNQMQDAFLDFIYPVGSIIYNADSNFNPNSEFGGTWEKIKGKMIIGYDESDSDFNTLKATGGSKTHTQTVDEIAKHTHGNMSDNNTNSRTAISSASGTGGPTAFLSITNQASFSTGEYIRSTGKSSPMDIMNPYYVANIWVRTA